MPKPQPSAGAFRYRRTPRQKAEDGTERNFARDADR
jgi:hypothetical protein